MNACSFKALFVLAISSLSAVAHAASLQVLPRYDYPGRGAVMVVNFNAHHTYIQTLTKMDGSIASNGAIPLNRRGFEYINMDPVPYELTVEDRTSGESWTGILDLSLHVKVSAPRNHAVNISWGAKYPAEPYRVVIDALNDDGTRRGTVYGPVWVSRTTFSTQGLDLPDAFYLFRVAAPGDTENRVVIALDGGGR